MQLRIPALLIAVGAVVALDGCGDPTAIQAQTENIDTTRTVYAINGTSPSLPSALNVRFASPVRFEPSFAFDLAFDLNAQNEVVLYTQRKIASQLVAGRRVGLQLSDKAFATITEAPTSGYVYDSLLVLPTGKTVLIDAIDAINCSSFSLLGQNIRAKMVIDSIDAAARAIFLHILANTNCGFKALVPGLPKG